VENKLNPETPPLDQINDTKMERAERDKKSKQKIVKFTLLQFHSIFENE